MTTHKDYDGREVSLTHLGFKGKAWLAYAGWNDQYIVMVDGVWANGNAVKGQLMRTSADEARPYLKG